MLTTDSPSVAHGPGAGRPDRRPRRRCAAERGQGRHAGRAGDPAGRLRAARGGHRRPHRWRLARRTRDARLIAALAAAKATGSRDPRPRTRRRHGGARSGRRAHRSPAARQDRQTAAARNRRRRRDERQDDGLPHACRHPAGARVARRPQPLRLEPGARRRQRSGQPGRPDGESARRYRRHRERRGGVSGDRAPGPAVGGPAQQPVPGPARPLRGARHDRVAVGSPRCDGCRRRRPSSSTSTTRRWPRSPTGSPRAASPSVSTIATRACSWTRFRMPRTPRRAGSCGQDLAYDRLYSAHLGAWRCPGCGAARPPLDFAGTSIALDGVDALRLDVSLRRLGGLALACS